MFELLKNNINLVQHIQRYTNLRQSGRTHSGLCPLHDDRQSPSLHVYPDNTFHCFGCQVGGDVVDFEAERQKLSMGDAARFLCEMYGIQPNYKDSLKWQKILALRKQKQEWLESLKDSFSGRRDIYDYVKSRGLSDATITDFKLGAAESKNILIIPIFDRFGKISGYARRNLDANKTNGLAKYENDSSDEIYNKSEILFGYDKAKYAVKETKSIILNEGYFDVMSLWEADLKQSVAFCGSQMTKEQPKLLMDIVDENCIIYLVPTNDDTGQDKLEKNWAQLKIYFPKNHIRCLVVPDDCKDLNDVLMKHGGMTITQNPASVPVEVKHDGLTIVDIFNNSISIELYLVKRILKTEPVLEMQYTKVRNLCLLVDNSMIKDDICIYLSKQWGKALESVKGFLGKSMGEEVIKASSFKTFSDLVAEYGVFVESIEKNKINFGYPKMDMITRGMHMGDVVTVVAASGVGKTMLAENLIRNISKMYAESPIIFYSLEQTGIMAFERFMQMEGELETHQVEKWKKNEDIDILTKINAAMQRLTADFKNVVIVDQGSMDLKKIEQYTNQASIMRFNQPVKLIVIDYLGYIRGEGKDLYHRVSDITREVKELAKRLNCAIILLCQVTKSGKTGGDPIEGYMARDSGVIMESADILFSAWRPELQEGISDDKRRDLDGVYMIRVAKNKYGTTTVKGRDLEFLFVKKHMKLLEKADSTFGI